MFWSGPCPFECKNSTLELRPKRWIMFFWPPRLVFSTVFWRRRVRSLFIFCRTNKERDSNKRMATWNYDTVTHFWFLVFVFCLFLLTVTEAFYELTNPKQQITAHVYDGKFQFVVTAAVVWAPNILIRYQNSNESIETYPIESNIISSAPPVL